MVKGWGRGGKGERERGPRREDLSKTAWGILCAVSVRSTLARNHGIREKGFCLFSGVVVSLVDLQNP